MFCSSESGSQSDQSGIEIYFLECHLLFQYHSLNRTKVELKSWQSAFLWRLALHSQSDQSGIEIIKGPGTILPAYSLNRTKVELKFE